MYSIRRIKAVIAARLALLRLRRFVRELWGYFVVVFVGVGVAMACVRFWYWLLW